ncbi:hypothetical protein [Bradyrhizobium sp. Leo121]|uniref:hypothetical protein n=1 Tax=Bradyrhizobium sp. Leo121 TaxID=1571195 RepID=UPI0013EF431D|nr:hypothetical protein [Bradyrhizobium sp. Leo121]
MSDTKRESKSPPEELRVIAMPKFSYQPIDSRTYSTDYQEPKKAAGDEVVSSLRNLQMV